jgi:GNAT superfamily N-acetyltransferase
MRIAFLADHPEHALTLARWHHREWSGLMRDWSREEAERELTGHATRRVIPTTLILVDDADELLGSVSLIDEDAREFADLSPWLASLFVAPPARGRGFGAGLVRAAVELAAQLGVPRLYLFTPEHADFYRRLGWREYQRRRLGDREVAVMCIDPPLPAPDA